MAIYTTNDFSMLSAKPLDAKRVMTFTQWDTDDMAGLSYLGQLYYDPNTGWFRIYGKDIDDPNGFAEDGVFAISTDFIYIANGYIAAWRGEPYITMRANGNHYPLIEMQNREGNWSYAGYSSDGIYYLNSEAIDPEQWINFYNGTMLFGDSNEIVSNTNNKVISMIGTGLTTANPQSDQLIIGKYNELDEYASFIIGSGSGNNNRKNILSVSSMDNVITMDEDVEAFIGAVNSTLCLTNFDQMLHVPDPQYSSCRFENSSYGIGSISEFYQSRICDRLIIKIKNAFQSSELLHIWTKSSSGSKKFIIQDYPIGQLSVNDMAIEQLLVDIDKGSTIWVSITGGNYADADHITERHSYEYNFTSRADIYLHTIKPFVYQF